MCYRDAVVVGAGGGQAGGGHVLGEGDGLAQPQDGEVVLLGLAAVAGVALRAAHPRPDLAIRRGEHLPVTEQRAAQTNLGRDIYGSCIYCSLLK